MNRRVSYYGKSWQNKGRDDCIDCVSIGLVVRRYHVGAPPGLDENVRCFLRVGFCHFLLYDVSAGAENRHLFQTFGRSHFEEIEFFPVGRMKIMYHRFVREIWL